MSQTGFTSRLQKFVEQVARDSHGKARPLTINDLQLGIRSERVTEISDWSGRDLDAIEIHASQFDEDAPLESVLQMKSVDEQVTLAVSVSSICSPSPFAWM